MAPKSVIIAGASGLLGRAVYKEFTSSAAVWHVTGLAFSRCSEEMTKVDITNCESVHELFYKIRVRLLFCFENILT